MDIYKEINAMPIKHLVVDLRDELNKLSTLQDMHHEDTWYSIQFIHASAIRARELDEYLIYDLFVYGKVVEVLRRVLFYNYSKMQSDKKLYERVELLNRAIWSASSYSEKIGNEIIRTGLFKDYILFLKNDEKIKDENYQCLFKFFLATLNNVLMKSSSAREAMRKEGAVVTFLKYQSHCEPIFKCISTLALAHLFTEAENSNNTSDYLIIKYLFQVLDSAIVKKLVDDVIFRTDEVLNGINILALNDSNKNKIIDADGLRYYVTFLKQEHKCSPDVIALAAHGVCILALKCQEQIIEYEGCLQALNNLVNHLNKKTRDEAKRALLVLQNENLAVYEKCDNRPTAGESFSGPAAMKTALILYGINDKDHNNVKKIDVKSD